MPVKSKTKFPVDEDTLVALKKAGAQSAILDLRLKFMELEGTARYLRGLKGRDKVYPRFHPIQASGRWSVSDPAMGNFPAHAPDECDRCKMVKEGLIEPRADGWCPRDVRGVPVPALGNYWLHFDLDGIEGRFSAAYTGDDEELEGYRKKWDLHTLNAADMFKMPRPPIYTKKVHDAPEGEAWRNGWKPAWSGGQDRRRHLAKTMKYAGQFAKDYLGMLDAKGIDKLGLSRPEVVKFAKMYLAAKPILTSAKAKKFEEYARTNVSRTFRGRRRRLAGDAWTRAKAGWSHEVQGSVPDIMNDYIIQASNDPILGKGWFILNTHDGLTWSVPESVPPKVALASMRAIVERDWLVNGRQMPVSAEWEIIFSDGTIKTPNEL